MGFLSRRMDRRVAAYQRDLMETHYAEVENMYRQVRLWRHDWRSHLQAMKAYAAQGDLEARNVLVEHNLRLVAHIVNKE